MNEVANTNPFKAAQRGAAQSTSLVEVESQRAIQEVQAAMVIAKKFPRNQIEAMDKILQACTRPTLAERALYSYGRGGTAITGPSIRLAEAIAQTWGNMQFGIRELSQSNGESTVEAFAWDVETNTRQVKIFQVPHERDNGKKVTTPRDVYELVANQGARRLRACILGVIPGDVIEAAVNQCQVTLEATADTSPEGIKKMLAVFSKFGVTQEMIEKFIQKRIESINPAQVVRLLEIAQSLRDGMSEPSTWFDMPQEQAVSAEQHATRADALKAKIRKPAGRQSDDIADTDAPPASSNWQPSEAELAEIKQREMAEAGDLLGDVPQ